MVGWAPVPKARPGSTTTSIAPSRGSSQEGRSQSRSPTSSGLWKSCQRSAQSSGTSVATDLDQAVAGRRLDLAQLRQLALAAVDRVLDVARAALLLDPVRRQHGQLGEDQLGLLGAAADREADQPKALRTRREEAALVAAAAERRLRGSSVSPSFSASSRCSSERSLRDDHVDDDHAGRRGGPPLAPRQAVAAQGELAAGLDAGAAARSRARPRGSGP